jgi:hypothetical protein
VIVEVGRGEGVKEGERVGEIVAEGRVLGGVD